MVHKVEPPALPTPLTPTPHPSNPQKMKILPSPSPHLAPRVPVFSPTDAEICHASSSPQSFHLDSLQYSISRHNGPESKGLSFIRFQNSEKLNPALQNLCYWLCRMWVESTNNLHEPIIKIEVMSLPRASECGQSYLRPILLVCHPYHRWRTCESYPRNGCTLHCHDKE